MAIPLAPAVVALISVVGVGIFKVVEGDHDRAFFLDPSSPILCGCMEYSTNADTLATGLATGVSKAPELLDHRLALYGAEQRMVFGANTYRAFVRLLALSTEESEARDPWVIRMRSLPATMVSTTLEEPSTGRTRPS
jgi:hypothetical protein